MELYGYYRSSAAYRIRIILNFKGISWLNRPVALNRGEQRGDAHLSLNPLGLVPVLVDGSDRMTQSTAIAEYLEERHPAPPLLPSDPLARARVREIQNVIGCDIHPLQNLRVLNHLKQAYGEDDDGTHAWCRHWIGAGLAAVERFVTDRSAHRRHCVGDAPTLADVWLVPQVYNARRFGLDLERFPTVEAIADHCGELPAFAAAHPAKQPDAPPTSP